MVARWSNVYTWAISNPYAGPMFATYIVLNLDASLYFIKEILISKVSEIYLKIEEQLTDLNLGWKHYRISFFVEHLSVVLFARRIIKDNQQNHNKKDIRISCTIWSYYLGKKKRIGRKKEAFTSKIWSYIS